MPFANKKVNLAFWIAGLVAIGLMASTAHAATNAASEAPQFTPVNFWVGPVDVSTKTSFFVDFDVYMASTTANQQSNAVALNFQSCNGSPLQLRTRTRHLVNGETLLPLKGGPGATTAIRWSRPMGVPPAGQAVKLHLSFIGTQPGYFCLYISDASEPFGPRYVQVDLGMK